MKTKLCPKCNQGEWLKILADSTDDELFYYLNNLNYLITPQMYDAVENELFRRGYREN